MITVPKLIQNVADDARNPYKLVGGDGFEPPTLSV
jgi:hypothetical protein